MLKLSARDGKRLADRLMTEPHLAPGLEPGPAVVDCGNARIDEATTAYVEAMQAPFDRLRQAEAQLAGLMVLAAASRRPVAGHPMLDLVAEAAAEAEDGIRTVKVPPQAQHHHHHVLEAARDIAIALDASRRCLRREDDAALDAAIAPLKAAHRHLLWATGALPGFEIVALSQACCAQHAPALQQ
jgi:hypothetical protein